MQITIPLIAKINQYTLHAYADDERVFIGHKDQLLDVGKLQEFPASDLQRVIPYLPSDWASEQPSQPIVFENLTRAEEFVGMFTIPKIENANGFGIHKHPSAGLSERYFISKDGVMLTWQACIGIETEMTKRVYREIIARKWNIAECGAEFVAFAHLTNARAFCGVVIVHPVKETAKKPVSTIPAKASRK